MSDAAFELQQVLALARSQHPDPTGWSLAVNVDWLERADFGVGAVRQIEMLLSGAPGACVSVRGPRSDELGVTVTSFLRPGHEHLWAAQLAWIEAQISSAGTAPVLVISECLTDAETHRRAVAGFDLVFEELAMERDLDPEALATWRKLGFRESGRRGRFERKAQAGEQRTS